MNYIYDILVNFDYNYFDFYDWNDNDILLHIKKLPIVKVNSDFLYNVKYNDVSVSKDLLDKIYNKVEFFKGNKCNKQNYICSMCDSKEAIVVQFDSNGKIKYRSSLLIDEEMDIIDICENIDVCNYSFVLNRLLSHSNFKTRKEIMINDFIVNELSKVSSDKLKYLYFDCFNIKENDVNIILSDIISSIENDSDSISLKIYDFLKLTSINNS